MSDQDRVEFFISYTSPDRTWAEWIASELTRAGHTSRVQAWDFAPGSNWVLEMNTAAQSAERTIAVLSPAFLESRYASAEWAAAFRDDPTGAARKLVPVRVRPCQPGGLLGSIVYIDLVGLPEDAARRALIGGLRMERNLPLTLRFPGKEADGGSIRPEMPRFEPPVWNVPVATRTFVGREAALDGLAQDLIRGSAEPATKVRTVHGLGGVGKTQLVARFARQFRTEYDVVWWIRAEQDAIRISDYEELAMSLGFVRRGEPDRGAGVAATKAWFERSSRWLLVFDNAPGPEAIGELLPEGRGGHVLITSRRHADWRALGAVPVPMSVFARKESVHFLIMRADDTDRDAADKVAHALGDLPLALEQAAAYMNEQAIGLSKYLARLGARAPELLAKGRPLAYEHTIASTWNLAFRELTDEPVTFGLLILCAHLAPDRIPREVLVDFATDNSNQPNQATTPSEAEDGIERLLSYALISPADADAVSIHRLVQQIVLARNESNATEWAYVAVSLLARLFPPDGWKPDQWSACARLFPHALAACDRAVKLDAALQPSAVLLRKMALYARGRADYTLARAQDCLAITLFTRVYGGDHPQVARTLGDLGLILEHLGDFSGARDAQERAVAMKEKAYGPDSPEVAITLGDLGNALAKLADFEGAQEAQQRVLSIYERVYGPNDTRVAVCLGNLGNASACRGDLATALEAQRRALSIYERVDPTDPRVGTALGNLGNSLHRLGDLTEASDAHERALLIEERAYGTEHPEVAITLGNLAAVLWALGRLAEARRLLERALAIDEHVYGPDHPHIAIVLTNLGNVLHDLGNESDAREARDRAVAITEGVYTSDHPYVAAARAYRAAFAEGRATAIAAHAYKDAREDDVDATALADVL
jgi:tetratricopeptide (TPR) repeat protein